MRKDLVVALIALFGSLNAQYTKIFDFSGVSNGASPYMSSLISDGTYLYGMTEGGGLDGFGVIFKIKPDGSDYTKILDFAGGSNGNYPNGSLLFDGTFLYGMTTNGGLSSNCGNAGCGILFKVKTDGTDFTKLLDFAGTSTGQFPYGSLIYDGTFLYGMTNTGGANFGGNIFKIKPDGSGYSTLLDFTISGGQWPRGSLVSDGTFFYGMTSNNGSNNAGVVFKIKPDGTQYTKLLDFAGTSNGRYPFGSLILEGAYLYGMTTQGGALDSGIVFKIKPDGSGYIKLLDFTGNSNGSFPNSSLISDGTYIYGMTVVGGTDQMGVLFKIKTDGSGFTSLCNFAGISNGRHPSGSPFSDGTFLYGMTTSGGANDLGTLFKYKISTTTSLDTYSNIDPGISIYPNPVSDQLNIHTNIDFNDATLIVYSCTGQPLKQVKNISGQKIILNRDNIPAGLYFIQISQDGNLISRNKVVVID